MECPSILDSAGLLGFNAWLLHLSLRFDLIYRPVDVAKPARHRCCDLEVVARLICVKFAPDSRTSYFLKISLTIFR